ncbi:hypothetical protein [Listeria seeligeri]|uniref:hypothetical protein n=1 Tax=Listeria seeligeri TaxID=1640 RepID=UPI001623D9F4|nr:hypothetical protein [Listeria seeligeri]MBC1817155.1 hypothetical protein [Listeria seeligeri]
MANLSEANGTMCISKEVIQNDFQSVEKLLTALITLETSSDYGLILYDDSLEIKCLLDDAKQSEADLTLEFSGVGRWAFDNNIEHFFESLSRVYPIEDFHAFSNPSHTVTFDFIDYEPCCEVFYHGLYDVSLQEVEKKWKTLSKERMVEEIAITAENLMKYGLFEDAYDATNLRLLLENEILINELAKCIPKNELSLHFFKKYWEEFCYNVIDGFAIHGCVVEMSSFYTNTYKEESLT